MSTPSLDLIDSELNYLRNILDSGLAEHECKYFDMRLTALDNAAPIPIFDEDDTDAYMLHLQSIRDGVEELREVRSSSVHRACTCVFPTRCSKPISLVALPSRNARVLSACVYLVNWRFVCRVW